MNYSNVCLPHYIGEATIFGAVRSLFLGKKIVACDTETTGLKYYGVGACRPFAFSFTTYENLNVYISFPVDPYTRRVCYECNSLGMEILIKFFSDENITKVFHNRNFDVSMIERSITKVKGKFFDTKILAHVHMNNLSTYKLKPLASSIAGIPMDDETNLKKAVQHARKVNKDKGYKLGEDAEEDYWLCPKECAIYAMTDADRTMALYWAYENYLTAQDHSYPIYSVLVNMELTLLDVLKDMQDTGIELDLSKISDLKKYYSDEIQKANKEKSDLGYGSLNPASPKQMKEVFYDQKNYAPVYKVRKTKNGRVKTLTTDSSCLAKWANEGDDLAQTLVKLQAAEHELNSFVIPFEEEADHYDNKSILHPQYNSLGATTGRLSCNKPNLMNISSNESANKLSSIEYRARECFIPGNGYVLYFPDYSQIEIWGSAFLSRDVIMMEALLNKADIHAITAKACWGHLPDFEENYKKYRKRAKFVNFGSIYGAGPEALAQQMGSTLQDGKQAYEAFWGTYIGLAKYRDEMTYEVRQRGYVENPFGRRYYVDSSEAYKILNYLVQGSCAEVIKRAMINVFNYLKSLNASVTLVGNNCFNVSLPKRTAKLLLTIHDELGIRMPVELNNKFVKRNIVSCMQGNFHEYFGMPVPFGVGFAETATNWAEKKEITL